jgi:putative transposase
MSQNTDDATRWARFRFAIIGPLLAAPPARGDLQRSLEALAQKTYAHPITGEPHTVSVQTIERWYYEARATDDPTASLRRKVRNDSGRFPSIKQPLIDAIASLYKKHPTWSYQLIVDNLRAMARADSQIGDVPSYATVRRYMKSRGWVRRRRRGDHDIEHGPKEIRSFEAAFVGELWHADFHHGSRKVLLPSGKWVTPKLLCLLDDRSRLCCHAQWYLGETVEVFVHGVTQALLKRGLPRALLTDNGSAMTAAETTEGLSRLGILHTTTLPYSPHQNGKQEAFFGPVEGRLLKMLDSVDDLDLRTLNNATQSWVELEHNRCVHKELDGKSPVDRWLDDKTVMRKSPDAQTIADAFTKQTTRKQRRSDNTLTFDGVRYELPVRYRHMETVCLRVRGWDKRSVLLIDAHKDHVLCVLYPLDKEKNADGRRGIITQTADAESDDASSGIAPLLAELIDDYEQAGLAAGYLHLDEGEDPDDAQ